MASLMPTIEFLIVLFCLLFLERRLRRLEKLMLPNGGKLVATIIEEPKDDP